MGMKRTVHLRPLNVKEPIDVLKDVHGYAVATPGDCDSILTYSIGGGGSAPPDATCTQYVPHGATGGDSCDGLTSNTNPSCNGTTTQPSCDGYWSYNLSGCNGVTTQYCETYTVHTSSETCSEGVPL